MKLFRLVLLSGSILFCVSYKLPGTKDCEDGQCNYQKTSEDTLTTHSTDTYLECHARNTSSKDLTLSIYRINEDNSTQLIETRNGNTYPEGVVSVPIFGDEYQLGIFYGDYSCELSKNSTGELIASIQFSVEERSGQDPIIRKLDRRGILRVFNKNTTDDNNFPNQNDTSSLENIFTVLYKTPSVNNKTEAEHKSEADEMKHKSEVDEMKHKAKITTNYETKHKPDVEPGTWRYRRQITFRFLIAIANIVVPRNCLKLVLCEVSCKDMLRDGPRDDEPENLPHDPPYLPKLLEAWNDGIEFAEQEKKSTCYKECAKKHTGCHAFYKKPWKWLITGTHRLNREFFDELQGIIQLCKLLFKKFS